MLLKVVRGIILISLIQAKSSQVYNNLGLDKDSKLTVEVIEASECISGQYENPNETPYVNLICGKLK